jgi:hypothetical protein
MNTSSVVPRVFLIAVVLFLLGFVGLAVFYLTGDTEPVYEFSAVDGPEAPDSIQNRIGDDAYTLDDQPQRLVLLDYTVDRERHAISGSVLNNTPQPHVSVQLAFDLYDAEDDLLETVGDTTGEVGPGATWRFSISYPPTISVADVKHRALRGTAKQIEGLRRDPTYPQNEPGAALSPEE